MPPWVDCLYCENQWCLLHEVHAFECSCPPIEEWGGDDPKEQEGECGHEAGGPEHGVLCGLPSGPDGAGVDDCQPGLYEGADC